MIVKKKAADDQLDDDDLLEGTDDYEDEDKGLLLFDEEKEDEEEATELLPEDGVLDDGQNRAEERFFLGTLAKLFRSQSTDKSKVKIFPFLWFGEVFLNSPGLYSDLWI